MEEKIEYLIKEARKLIREKGLPEIILCSYHGRERGEYFNIDESEIEARIKTFVYEGFYVDLVPTLSQLIFCTWEYPGPKPEQEFVSNLVDIPTYVKALEGE